MNRDTGTIKCIARKKLMGNYGVLVGAVILAQLIPSLLLSLFQAVIDLESRSGYVVYTVAELIIALLSMVISVGFVYMIMSVLRGGKVTYSDLFYAFKNHPDRYILAGILEIVIFLIPVLPGYIMMMAFIMTEDMVYFAPAMFLFAAGIIIEVILVLKFAMVFEIMLDNPSYGVVYSFKESSAIMKGHKGRLFYLGISFIGWFILGLLSAGIGFLWITVYMNAAMIVFYFDITGEVMDDEELVGTQFDEAL